MNDSQKQSSREEDSNEAKLATIEHRSSGTKRDRDMPNLEDLLGQITNQMSTLSTGESEHEDMLNGMWLLNWIASLLLRGILVLLLY